MKITKRLARTHAHTLQEKNKNKKKQKSAKKRVIDALSYYLVCNVAGEPVQTLIQALTRCCTGALYVPAARTIHIIQKSIRDTKFYEIARIKILRVLKTCLWIHWIYIMVDENMFWEQNDKWCERSIKNLANTFSGKQIKQPFSDNMIFSCMLNSNTI